MQGLSNSSSNLPEYGNNWLTEGTSMKKCGLPSVNGLKLIAGSSGVVTRVGVTRGGDWRCHSYFSPQKLAIFLVIATKWWPFLAVASSQLHNSHLPISCCPVFLVNSATFFSFWCHPPWVVSPGAVAPPPSDATGLKSTKLAWVPHSYVAKLSLNCLQLTSALLDCLTELNLSCDRLKTYMILCLFLKLYLTPASTAVLPSVCTVTHH